MASIPAGDAARAPRLVLRADSRVRDARARLAEAALPGAPVVEQDASFRGTVTVEMLATAGDDAVLREIADGGAVISADDGLDDALGTLADQRADWAPVVADGRLVGILSARDAMRAYRRALAGNVRQVRGLGAGGVLLEVDLAASSTLVGSSVAAAGWPPDVVLVAIERDGSLIVPRGEVVLLADDRLSLFAAPSSVDAARDLLSAPSTAAPEARSRPTSPPA